MLLFEGKLIHVFIGKIRGFLDSIGLIGPHILHFQDLLRRSGSGHHKSPEHSRTGNSVSVLALAFKYAHMHRCNRQPQLNSIAGRHNGACGSEQLFDALDPGAFVVNAPGATSQHVQHAKGVIGRNLPDTMPGWHWQDRWVCRVGRGNTWAMDGIKRRERQDGDAQALLVSRTTRGISRDGRRGSRGHV